MKCIIFAKKISVEITNIKNIKLDWNLARSSNDYEYGIYACTYILYIQFTLNYLSIKDPASTVIGI